MHVATIRPTQPGTGLDRRRHRQAARSRTASARPPSYYAAWQRATPWRCCPTSASRTRSSVRLPARAASTTSRDLTARPALEHPGAPGHAGRHRQLAGDAAGARGARLPRVGPVRALARGRSSTSRTSSAIWPRDAVPAAVAAAAQARRAAGAAAPTAADDAGAAASATPCAADRAYEQIAARSRRAAARAGSWPSATSASTRSATTSCATPCPAPSATCPTRSCSGTAAVLTAHYAAADAALGRAIAALRPGDLLLVVSGFGMEPLSMGKRLLERAVGNPDLSGTHERAPDGFLMAFGTDVRPGRLSRGVDRRRGADDPLLLRPAGRPRHGRLCADRHVHAGVHARSGRSPSFPTLRAVGTRLGIGARDSGQARDSGLATRDSGFGTRASTRLVLLYCRSAL